MDQRYDSKIAESSLIKQWEDQKTYSPQNNPGTFFSIDTPPPTVSGNLHIGHIFSYTQTDIIARYKRMNGYSVFYPFGFDDNGLPTERYVEKKRDIRAQNLSRSEFIKICLEETAAARDQFINLWQRMGLSVDWHYCYSTISESARKISQQSFIELYKKGMVYRKDEPALYCVTCRTSVAQAELEDQDMPSSFNDILFKSDDGKDLVISTTRPELLPSVVAVLFNPNDTRYQHLQNRFAIVPLFGQKVRLLPDEKVIIEKGTGLVMVATYGDKTDIEWVKKHNLPYQPSIGRDGKWLESTGILAGLKAHEARARIIQELKNNHLLLNQKDITHPVNVHERCKKEIEYLNLTQWFVSLIPYKEEFIRISHTIGWFPPFMKSRFDNWVENVSWDWCISRQRFYGIPFPAWYCNPCNELLLPSVDQLPVDPQETAFPGKHCTRCKSTDIRPDTDVMDTWNTSSLTPYLCFNVLNPDVDPINSKEAQGFLPMSMRPQAHDIIRTWAFYTIVKTWMHNNIIPWNEIVISGHVLSDQKEKLSKSLDQKKLAPQTLLDTYSADVIRYWTASGTLGHDVMFSEAQLKIGQRLVTKLWNAFRFAHQHLEGFVPGDEPATLGTINEWILDKASRCFEAYTNYFKHHEFGLALHPVEEFFWNDFCDNYVELIKHQLFNPDQFSPQDVYATKHTLYRVGLRILQWYAPYLPFVTEAIYQESYKKGVGIPSIHQTKFDAVQKLVVHAGSVIATKHMIDIVSKVRKLKTAHQLSLKTPLTVLTIIIPNASIKEMIQRQEVILKGVSQAATIEYLTGTGTDELVHENELYRATVVVTAA